LPGWRRPIRTDGRTSSRSSSRWTATRSTPPSTVSGNARRSCGGSRTPGPDVTILVDHYDEDWSGLWWIRLRGRARVLDDGDERERALALLAEKYPQYRTEPPDGPVLAVDVTEIRDWRA
jgi:PPOX class probable F420-dependent enzyme